MSAPELKPCPFCGESLTQRGEGLNYRHPENDCIFGSWVFTSDQIPAWNTRASDAESMVAGERALWVKAIEHYFDASAVSDVEKYVDLFRNRGK